MLIEKEERLLKQLNAELKRELTALGMAIHAYEHSFTSENGEVSVDAHILTWEAKDDVIQLAREAHQPKVSNTTRVSLKYWEWFE
jgi:hypothetical protein